MDDKTKMILKIAVIGIAVYVGYRYLQSSGLWAQWFPGSVPAPPPDGALAAAATIAGPVVALAGPQPDPQPARIPIKSSPGFHQTSSAYGSAYSKSPYRWLSTKVQ